MAKRLKEREFEFTLTLEGVGDRAAAAEALYESGCDDATILHRWGRAFVTFNRAAASFRAAIESALSEVTKANVGTACAAAPAPLVNQAEVARRSGRSRASVNQLVNGTRGPGGFPGPVYGGVDEPHLWRWCEVAEWLHGCGVLDWDAVVQAEYLDALNARLAIKWRSLRTEPTPRVVSSRPTQNPLHRGGQRNVKRSKTG